MPEVRFKKVTLPNGLDVIARRQGDLPIVAVNLWYHVGSKNEAPRQRGFAHLFEHLMFEGSEHYPHDFFKPLQRRGANINGSTSTDRTNYFVDLPTAHVELALAMESDRMGHFLPTLTAEKLRIQKDVVKNEYRQNYANRPYGQVWRLLAETMFPAGHPYSWTTIGLMEDVEAAGLDDVEGFFRRFYVPANASLCIVGDMDEDEAIGLAEKYFGSIPGGAVAHRPECPPAGFDANREVVLHDKVELERFYFSWHTVHHFLPDDQALDTLADLLSRGKSARLYKKLVMERELLQDVSAHQSGRELAGTFGVSGTLRPGTTVEQAQAAVFEEISDLAKNGPTPEELARVKSARSANFIYALDNVGGFGGVADRLNAYNTYLGDPGRLREDLEESLAVRAEDVARVAREYLDGKPHARLLATGRKSPTVLPPLDRSVPPAPSQTVSFRAPVPETTTLKCGIPLWVIPRRDLPIVSASFVLPAGAVNHDASRGGLANLVSSLIDEGTKTRTTHQLASEAESVGTHLSTSCGWDGAYVSLQCLTDFLPQSLDLVVDMMLNASFPESEFRRIKGQTLASLRSDRDRAESLANRAFARAVFGETHPFGVPVEGTEASVGRLEREHLVEFFRTHHIPNGSALVIAGDIDIDRAASLVEPLLSGWEPGEPVLSKEMEVPQAGGTRLILIDRPGASQAVVRVGHLGTDRSDPLHTEVMVANHILGGLFTSRLNAKLREEKGYTYGVRSQFEFRRKPGPFAIGASLQSDRLADAVGDLRHVVDTFLSTLPPTASEIDDAKRSLIEGQARSFETPSSLVSRYGSLLLHGLPADEHAKFPERVSAVTPESALAAAQARIFPGSMTVVVVADSSQVLEPLRKLGWGDIQVVNDRGEVKEMK